MDYIKLPAGSEIRAIEYLSKKYYFAHRSSLLKLSYNQILEFCSRMAYEPDLEVNQVVIPSHVFSGVYGVNCKDFALIGVMYALSHNLPYEIIEEPNHVYLKINGQIFDPVKIITGE